MTSLSLKRPYHSASVSMSLLVGDEARGIAQSGPGFAMLVAPLTVAEETPAILLVRIDGKEQRHPIRLLPTGDDPSLVRFAAR